MTVDDGRHLKPVNVDLSPSLKTLSEKVAGNILRFRCRLKDGTLV